MPETRLDDSPRPKLRSVGGIATSNKAAPRCGGPLVAAAAIIHALFQRKKNNRDKLFVNSNVKKNPGINQSGVERFSLKDLQVATDNFSPKNIIGRGGFGTVYKGCLSDGSVVALKRLKKERNQGGELQCQCEVEMISMAIHRNLLRLRGFCMTPEEWILVYPFMPNGSVASYLREHSESQPPLSWEIRKRIAFGAARGLAYLHEDCDPKIIHRDVKSANIFLDEEFEAVVGEFGLVKLMNYKDTHVTTAVRGTLGHIAPEYLSTGKSSEKTDIYGYGVMLLELVSGQNIFDLTRLANDEDAMLLDWVKGLMTEKKFDNLVDKDLHSNFYVDEVEDLLHIALCCTEISPMERPKMSEIVTLLSQLLNKRSHNLKMPRRSPQASPSLPSSSSPASASTHTQSQQTKAQSQASKVAARKDKEMWLGNLKCFSLKEIVKATDDFNQTFILGKGAFGNVYKGELPDGHVVAIKRLVLKDKQILIDEEHNQVGELQFQAEIEMIGKAIHRNLLRLLGYCVTPTERILVYPFMVNGSVASWLKGRNGVQPLVWEIRKKIAVGAAKGFAYLHNDCNPKIIHRDVKAENILLDEDFEAKVADFGLVKFLEQEDTHVTTDVRGTPGYIAPEYFSTRRTSARTDVFGYGRTLMEIVSGKRPFELAKAANDSDFTEWVCKMLKEKKWEIIVDASLQGNYVEDEVERFIQVALLCTQHSAKKRPEMSEVITMLEGNDGNRLDTRWEEWQQLLEHDKTDQSYTNINFSKTFESLFNLKDEELSAP